VFGQGVELRLDAVRCDGFGHQVLGQVGRIRRQGRDTERGDSETAQQHDHRRGDAARMALEEFAGGGGRQ
jgi:hypothetical protein